MQNSDLAMVVLTMRQHQRAVSAIAVIGTVVGQLICQAPSLALAQGPGDLQVTPTRIVFANNQRSAEVSLVHRGTTEAEYRISFQNMRMTETGQLIAIEDGEEVDNPADPIIRYSPRQIVLQPGDAQSVRLLVRKPANLPSGEYRSHLLFRAVPPENIVADIETLDELDEGEIRVQLVPIYGVSIPVIIQHGNGSASVGLRDLVIQSAISNDNPPTVTGRMDRSGEFSVYGNFAVIYDMPSGDQLEVGRANGVAVYTNLDSRTFRLPLRLPDGIVLNGGRLRVTYSARPDAGGAVLAEAELAVP